MVNPIGTVDWIVKNERMDDLLKQEESFMIQPLDQGAEAEVMKICSATESFVLKVWNKRSKPDISFQYHLLKVLYERGLSVSEPVGWGVNSNGDKALLVTFDGLPILKVNNKKMKEIANLLLNIHQIDVKEIENIQFPTYEFIDYFFPRVKEQGDIYNTVISLVQKVEIKQEHLIHGDFHLRNIVEKNDQYSIIDWTNGQLGDPRYDFAWSLILLKIYVSEHSANAFRSAYLLENDIPQKELEVFEALASLRWIVLHRSGGVPEDPNIIKKVRGLLTNNPFLKEFEWVLGGKA